MEKIGLDLGNSSIKMVGGEKEDLVFKRIRSLATTDSEDNNHVVTMDNRTIYFGVGTSLIENDKTERAYLKESILLATYELYGTGEHEIGLGLTLPINLYKLTKETFKKQIEAFKEIKGKVNGKHVSVKLEKVNVQAEGLAAFYALMPEIPKGPILFIDLGHRTIDIIAANIDTDTGKWKLETPYTIQKGGYDLLNKLQSALYLKLKNFFTIEQIEQIIAAGGKVGGLNVSDIYQEALQEEINVIVKDIHNFYTDMLYRQVYICGGAAPMFKACYQYDNLTMVQDDKMIYSNAVGSYLRL